jgi:hypothetical protein
MHPVTRLFDDVHGNARISGGDLLCTVSIRRGEDIGTASDD